MYGILSAVVLPAVKVQIYLADKGAHPQWLTCEALNSHGELWARRRIEDVLTFELNRSSIAGFSQIRPIHPTLLPVSISLATGAV